MSYETIPCGPPGAWTFRTPGGGICCRTRPGRTGLSGMGEVLTGVPSRLEPGRYQVGLTIRGVTGDATEDPPAIVPFLWNWDKGPFGSGKVNLERELARAGVRATAVSAGNPRWSNPRRSGKLDLLGLSPMLWDVSFEVTLDIFGPAAPGSGLGLAPVIWVGGTLLILGLTHAIVKTLGGGDVVIDFVLKVAELPLKLAGGIAKKAVESAFSGGTGLVLLALVGVGVYAWVKFSPHGRAARKVVWG